MKLENYIINLLTYEVFEFIVFSSFTTESSFFGEQLRLFSFLSGEVCPLLTSFPLDFERDLYTLNLSYTSKLILTENCKRCRNRIVVQHF